MKKHHLRIRYAGKCWVGQQWVIEERHLGFFWIVVTNVYGTRQEAEAEMALFAANP